MFWFRAIGGNRKEAFSLVETTFHRILGFPSPRTVDFMGEFDEKVFKYLIIQNKSSCLEELPHLVSSLEGSLKITDSL